MQLSRIRSIYYSDVNLLASPTALLSRADIPKELWRIFASPMAAVAGYEFNKAALELGINAIVHRFQDEAERLRQISALATESGAEERLWAAIGLGEQDFVPYLINGGAKNICLDIANGYLIHSIDYLIEIIKAAQGKIKKVMVANIHSDSMMPYIAKIKEEFGRDVEVLIRVGIGNGSPCTTKDATGVNRGQMTEIEELHRFITNQEYNFTLISDGGIRTSGDAAKAFGAGAGGIMLGGYFARAKESQNYLDGHKLFWGGASHKQRELVGADRQHAEGKEIIVDNHVPLSELVDDLWGSISSAVSYSGKKTLTEFIGEGLFEFKE